ncbi:thioredoxin [Levilactobacillus brevis]|uniref:thioredoxin family protein n=1 Tax=Levilactobacillus brevis TaxID=1580 RepID=UPI0005A622F0|nr:thioredoxin family protein [Levilactobacillus brevis]RDF13013.1 thioredoxin [Levilactobacillus brevis]
MKKSSIALMMVLLVVLAIGAFVFHRKTATPLTRINTEQLNKLVTRKKKTLIYIGRPDCPACDAFSSKMNTELKNNIFRPTVYYYNTNANRNNKNFASTLKGLNITSVPDFLVIKNGKIAKTYTGFDDFYKAKPFIEGKY